MQDGERYYRVTPLLVTMGKLARVGTGGSKCKVAHKASLEGIRKAVT
jgi:hypothetical protein